MVTIETAHGATYFKLNGITRAIWLPRSLSPKSGVTYNRANHIAIFMLCGWGFVIAPFRPRLK